MQISSVSLKVNGILCLHSISEIATGFSLTILKKLDFWKWFKYQNVLYQYLGQFFSCAHRNEI